MRLSTVVELLRLPRSNKGFVVGHVALNGKQSAGAAADLSDQTAADESDSECWLGGHARAVTSVTSSV